MICAKLPFDIPPYYFYLKFDKKSCFYDAMVRNVNVRKLYSFLMLKLRPIINNSLSNTNAIITNKMNEELIINTALILTKIFIVHNKTKIQCYCGKSKYFGCMCHTIHYCLFDELTIEKELELLKTNIVCDIEDSVTLDDYTDYPCDRLLKILSQEYYIPDHVVLNDSQIKTMHQQIVWILQMMMSIGYKIINNDTKRLIFFDIIDNLSVAFNNGNLILLEFLFENLKENQVDIPEFFAISKSKEQFSFYGYHSLLKCFINSIKKREYYPIYVIHIEIYELLLRYGVSLQTNDFEDINKYPLCDLHMVHVKKKIYEFLEIPKPLQNIVIEYVSPYDEDDSFILIE